MVRSFALVKIYGMAREGRSLVSGQYPRVKARLVSLYWIAFLSAPTAQQPALEIQPREDIRRCRGDEIAIYEPQSKNKIKFYKYPRVKARLVSLYWIALLSAPTAQQPALEIQPREDIRRCRGDE
ncbi:BQ5605_C015g08030 [Microbotryum silenes-dioicae]|uniref:BQ5605_C015g08030 protein n=1 Tax=Microbotryum silenes-dioicae TaxID=796604 RepID=A0A2X0LTG0_9BASI|nr:BQ5605_C015g08030 [Microbotryum silenes-dioicae]